MELYDLWFVLISVLFIGFFFLRDSITASGFCCRSWAKMTPKRRQIVNTIGPVWDANRSLDDHGGRAILPRSRSGNATLFSGFYLRWS